MKAIHRYNGIEANQPNNFEGTNFQLIFDADGNANISTTLDLEIGLGESQDAWEILKGWKEGGAITQGVPYEVELLSKDKKIRLFEGYINLFSAKYNDTTKLIQAQAERTGGLDWLSTQGAGITFDYLYSIGVIKDSDFVDVPYVINRVGRNSELFLAILTGFVVTVQIRQAIKDLQEVIADTANPLTSINGVIKIVAQVVYLTFLFASLTALILEALSLLINPTKFHKGMKYITMVERMCEYFGLKLVSSILYSAPYKDMVHLPEKWGIFRSEARRFLGRTSKLDGNDRGYFRGNFQELLEAIRAMFYARIIVKDNTLYFEPDNFRFGSPRFTLPPLDFQSQTYQYNVEDFYSNFILEFISDIEDRNTILEYKGNSLQVITKPTFMPNQMRNLAARMNRVTIPFARGRRKNRLNFVEQAINIWLSGIKLIINILIAAINAIIAAINAILRVFRAIVRVLNTIGIRIRINIPQIPRVPTFQGFGTLNDRKNILVLESDFVDIPKVLICRPDGRLAPENDTHINAKYLYDNFHFYRSFANGLNQWKITEFQEIGISFEDWELMQNNDFAFNDEGNEMQILEANFNPYNQTLSGKYRIRENYAGEFAETFIEPE